MNRKVRPGIILLRFLPNTDNQITIHIPTVPRILRYLCQALSVPVLVLLTLYHISDRCPPNQTILIPRLAIYWERSLRHMIQDF